MYTNSQKFFDNIVGYQKGRAQVMQEYEQAAAAAKPFEGSEYHAQAMKEAREKRDADLMSERRYTVAAMKKLFDAMRETVKSRPFKAPSQDAANVLQIIKLMPNPDRTALTAAEAFLKDEPFALAALDQLAAEHNIHLAGPRQPSVESVLSSIDTMERSFYNALNDTHSSLYNYLPPDEQTCIARFAAIPYAGIAAGVATPNTAAIEALCAEINGPEAEA